MIRSTAAVAARARADCESPTVYRSGGEEEVGREPWLLLADAGRAGRTDGASPAERRRRLSSAASGLQLRMHALQSRPSSPCRFFLEPKSVETGWKSETCVWIPQNTGRTLVFAKKKSEREPASAERT